jgi:hypothetical protein
MLDDKNVDTPIYLKKLYAYLNNRFYLLTDND